MRIRRICFQVHAYFVEKVPFHLVPNFSSKSAVELSAQPDDSLDLAIRILPIRDIRPRPSFSRPGNTAREWPTLVSLGSILYNQTPWSCRKNTLPTIASTQLLEFQPLKPLLLNWLTTV